MSTIGICTKQKLYEFNFETKALYDEAKSCFNEVILIDPSDVIYLFIEENRTPSIIHQNEELSSLTTLIVRGTSERTASTALLVHTLDLCGCKILDPFSRFSVGYASKLITTVTRYKRGIGSDSYFAFTLEKAKLLVKILEKNKRFPLIAKPITGRQGRGVSLIQSTDKAIDFVEDFFRYKQHVDFPVFFQAYENLIDEFRVIVVEGEPVGVVKKIPSEETIAVNAAQGASFIPVNAPDVVSFTIENVSKEGILGVDIGITTEGNYRIIEENRAPLWRTFESVTGINVAEKIIEQALKKTDAIEGSNNKIS